MKKKKKGLQVRSKNKFAYGKKSGKIYLKKKRKGRREKKRKAADHFPDAKVDFEKHSSLHVSYKGNFTRNRQKWGEGGGGWKRKTITMTIIMMAKVKKEKNYFIFPFNTRNEIRVGK